MEEYEYFKKIIDKFIKDYVNRKINELDNVASVNNIIKGDSRTAYFKTVECNNTTRLSKYYKKERK